MKALPSIAFNDFSGTAGDVTARFAVLYVDCELSDNFGHLCGCFHLTNSCWNEKISNFAKSKGNSQKG